MKNPYTILALSSVLLLLAVMAAGSFGNLPDGWNQLLTGVACLPMFAATRDPALRARYRWTRWLSLFMLAAGIGEIIWGLVILL